MATISLKTVGGYGKPGLLSEVFKGAFGDPELKAKLALTSAQIWSLQHANQLHDAQQEYARQQGLGEAQKTTDLQRLAKAREDAVAGLTAGEVSAVPLPKDQPVPVELSRITGPVNGVPVSAPPAIVDQNYYDDQVKAARARAGLMPFIAKDATDVSTAYNKDIGGATLAGALTPGGPAAVRTTPDQLRVAGELYTGNAPTTTTMVTSEDTAPALNAVRETAGKLPYDITRDQAAAEAKAKAEAAAAPFGSDTRAHAAAIVAAYEAKLARNETPLPGEAEQARQAREILARENTLVTPDKSKVQTFNDKTGKWEASDAGAPAAESSAYADATGQDPTEIRHLDEVSARIHDDPAYKPSTLSYTDYDSMFTNQYLSPKAIQDTGPNKEPVIRWLYRTKPASVLTPAQVQARMQGLPLPPAEPLKLLPPPDPNAAGTPAVNATGSAAAAAGMPPSVVTQVIGPPPKVVMTAEQMRDAKLAPQLLNAFSEILKTDPADLPGPFWQVWANPSNDPSTIQTYIEQMADPAARRYAQALNQFALNLYSLSGAAFPGGEKPQNIRTFVMSQADNLDPQTRANKVKAMANLVNSMHLAAFWNDDARRHAFQQDALKLGIKLSDRDVAPIQDDPYAAPAAGATDPAATAAPTTFSDGKPLTPMPQGLGIDPANWPNFDEQGRADAYQLEKMLKAKGAP